jgi:glucose-6-phosphate isomerase
MFPFQLDLTPESFRQYPGAMPLLRRLADVADIFGDADAVARRAAENPLIYEFIDLRKAVSDSRMSFGLTILQPGTIGGEFYMTRGHFHAQDQDGDELYLGVSGEGLLQLQARGGEGREMALRPGGLFYTPLAWAHRTINTGREPLVFLSIWPSATAYDYEEITRRSGFPRRVMEVEGKVATVENEQFHVK